MKFGPLAEKSGHPCYKPIKKIMHFCASSGFNFIANIKQNLKWSNHIITYKHKLQIYHFITCLKEKSIDMQLALIAMIKLTLNDNLWKQNKWKMWDKLEVKMKKKKCLVL